VVSVLLLLLLRWLCSSLPALFEFPESSGRATVGRYNKYSRHLSQTPWLINGQRKSATSVEELVCTRVAKKVGAKGMHV